MKFYKKRAKGGVTSYVMVMFGLIVIMYLMGFQSAYSDYTSEGRTIAKDGEDSITDQITDSEGSNFNILSIMVDGIKQIFVNPEDGSTNWWSVIGAVAITVAGLAIAKFAGGQYAFAYIIPIALFTIFANIFIFPIHHVSGDLLFFNGAVPLNIMLLAFFNLWLILSIVEFVRGQTS